MVREKLEKNTSICPDIASLVCDRAMLHFRSHVVFSADERVGSTSSRVNLHRCSLYGESLAQAYFASEELLIETNCLVEVYDLEISQAIECDIGWLDVPMSHSHGLQIVEGLTKLVHDLFYECYVSGLNNKGFDILEAAFLAGFVDEEYLIVVIDHEVHKVDDTFVW